MNKTLRTLLLSLICAVILVAIAVGAFSAAAVTDDPQDSYQKQEAEYEDSRIDLWFEHSFKKVMTHDVTPSGMDTYSVYMAKNEIENAQFILYSDETISDLYASVTSFKDANGNEIPAEVYYELYITLENLDSDTVLGFEDGESFIREGEMPDPVCRLADFGTFQLNGGKSQAFFIKLKTKADTPSGWYSAQLDITNDKGQQIKTATVFCYVWDFALSEKTALQSSFLVNNELGYGGNYKQFYDYLLENRLMPMDLPGGFHVNNPYLTNERISAIRVTASGGGYNNTYTDTPELYYKYRDLYNQFSNSPLWEDLKDKFYFYSIDEPRAKEICDLQNWRTNTIDGAKQYATLLKYNWPDAEIVIPQHDNHPYPYYTYHKPISEYATYEVKDAIQELIDTESITIWCPMIYALTPQYEVEAYGYDGSAYSKVRSLSNSNSGLYTTGSEGAWNINYDYYSWEEHFGNLYDRAQSQIVMEKEKGNKYQLWAYTCEYSRSYTYTNHLIEGTGLQHKMMMWQLYQDDVTGYLYYGTNYWNEYDSNNGKAVDTTVTGNWTDARWKTNEHVYTDKGISIYGNGVLFYGPSQGGIFVRDGVVGTLRVEIMRDGVEEYQMFTMLEDYVGEKEAKALVGKVSNNVANYLSLPAFSTSEWDSDMDEYDIMESVRRELGDTLEKVTKKDQCDHSFDEGEVVLEATCLEVGTLRRTCTKCDVTTDDVIPTLHATGESYERVSKTDATCMTDGYEIVRCTICANEKKIVTTAFHQNSDYLKLESKSDAVHNCICTVCGDIANVENHSLYEKHTSTCTEEGEIISYCIECDFSEVIGTAKAKGHNLKETTVKATCTADGMQGLSCTNCDYTEATVIPATGHTEGKTEAKDPTCDENGYERVCCSTCGEIISEAVIDAKGHKYVEGSCTVCGEADPDYVAPAYTLGDINADGAINGKDSNQLKQFISGSSMPTDIESKAADVNGDGAINGVDANIFAQFLAGALGSFE